MLQPSLASSFIVSSSSTPSATTFSWRLWARSMVERTMNASPVLEAIRATNVRSIFSSFTGSSFRYTSDE